MAEAPRCANLALTMLPKATPSRSQGNSQRQPPIGWFAIGSCAWLRPPVNGGSILCSLNVKTARWWRGIVDF
jgi:hypothetical protein